MEILHWPEEIKRRTEADEAAAQTETDPAREAA
jgi:hypothetical protein